MVTETQRAPVAGAGPDLWERLAVLRAKIVSALTGKADLGLSPKDVQAYYRTTEG